MSSQRDDAIGKALKAIRRYERGGRGSPCAMDVLERELDWLDWGFGGNGFEAIRELAERAWGPPPRTRARDGSRSSYRRQGDAYYDHYARTRESALETLKEIDYG